MLAIFKWLRSVSNKYIASIQEPIDKPYQVPSRGEPHSPGEIDYNHIFDLLKKLGYNGFIGLEYKPISDTISGLQWINEMGLEKNF